jgi:hypothetical protein
MTTLMEQEKQRISGRLARLDAEREKLSGQLKELARFMHERSTRANRRC